jgi:FixJ family two-component response regulator
VTSTEEIVYLIDDDSRVREALCEVLASHNVRVVSFASAREYLGFPRSEAVACLVLDLELPDINGLDLQQQLSREAGPPIVFISGHGDIPLTVRAMKAGAIEFLTKPVEAQALLASIREGFALDRAMRAKGADAKAQTYAADSPRAGGAAAGCLGSAQ